MGAVFRAMSWVGGGHVVGQGFWVGSLIALAAMLPPRSFGIVTVGLLMVTAATRLMESGTRGSMIVATDLTRQQVMTSLAVNVGGGLILSTAMIGAAGPVAHSFASGGNADVLRALALSTTLYAPAIVPLTLLERHFSFRRRAMVQATATVSASTVSVLAAIFGAGVAALVIRQLVFTGLLAAGGWIAARRLLPPRAEGSRVQRWQRLRRKGAAAFMLFSLTDFVVFNADYIIVGRLTNATQLGLYSLAFTIAFAPVTQFSAQMGSVLFPAAAASDAGALRRRTLGGARLTCLVFFPLIPVAVVLAPTVIPAVLGERWSGMVPPFQMLIAVGVMHAVVNVIGESLAGTGNMRFRTRVNLVWTLGMIAALFLLVRVDGIRGAAVAHLLLYVPVAVAYAVWGLPLLGLGWRSLNAALRPVAALLLVQGIVTAATVAALDWTSVAKSLVAAAAVGLGLVAAAAWVAVVDRESLAEARAFFTAGRRGA